MALALDSSAIASFAVGTTRTWSHTCTGSTLILVVSSYNATGLDHTTGVTYNGVAMTKINSIAGTPAIISAVSMWYLVNPATGANNVVVTSSASDNQAGTSESFTGAAQSGQMDSNATGNNSQLSAGTFTLPTTVVASNCWLVMGAIGDSATPTAGGGTTIRQSSGSGFATGDSNATVSTGSQSLAFAGMGANARGVIASIVPFTSGGATVLPWKALMGVGT